MRERCVDKTWLAGRGLDSRCVNVAPANEVWWRRSGEEQARWLEVDCKWTRRRNRVYQARLLGRRKPGEGAMGFRGVARNEEYRKEGAVVSLEIVYKNKSGSCFPRQRARERYRFEQNWTWLALGRWWLGYGLANGAVTPMMTPVAAGTGLQRHNNKHRNQQCLLPLEFQGALD
jgi:hypothetical protein